MEKGGWVESLLTPGTRHTLRNNCTCPCSRISNLNGRPRRLRALFTRSLVARVQMCRLNSARKATTTPPGGGKVEAKLNKFDIWRVRSERGEDRRGRIENRVKYRGESK